MATATTFWKVVRSTHRDHWNTAGAWLGYTVLFGLLPIGLAVVGQLAAKTHNVRWLDFMAHGELLLFCTSLVANTTRLMGEQQGKRAFVRPTVFHLSMWTIVLLSTGLFAAVKVLASQNLELNGPFIASFSILAWLSSVGLSFIIVLLDSTRVPVNVEQSVGLEQEKLSKGMDAL